MSLKLFNSRIATYLLITLAVIALPFYVLNRKFDVFVRLHEDGSFTYQYAGRADVDPKAAAAGLAWAEGQGFSRGKTTTYSIGNIGAQATPGRLTWTVSDRLWDELGNEREILLEQEIGTGQVPNRPPFITLSKGPDNAFTISELTPEVKPASGTHSGPARLKGTLRVYLPPGATLISHNASSTPGFFSDSYQWTVGGSEPKPSLTFKMASR